VAQGVVDLLEVIEVDEHEAQRALVAQGPAALGAQGLVEGPVVGQAGERIGDRLGGEAPWPRRG
jgi:hypothetical protein